MFSFSKKNNGKCRYKNGILFPSLKNESCKDNNIDTFAEINKPHFIPPIVYGEVKSKKNPQGKTILFYNHYDVQPKRILSNYGKIMKLLVVKLKEIIFMEEAHQMIKVN